MAATKKSEANSEKFMPMESAQAVLDDAWKYMREMLGHSPDTAQRIMTAAIRGFHKSETAVLKKATARKKTAKKAVKKAAHKVGKKVAHKAARKTAKKTTKRKSR